MPCTDPRCNCGWPKPDYVKAPDFGTPPEDPNPPRREPLGIVLGSVLMVLGIVAGVLATRGGLWYMLWLVAVSFTPFGLIGFAIDVQKVRRDSEGRPL